ncbi:MAG: DMT family transporter, partial [Clostridia bacterium]|nr:DMT family transporter [Clostridia bacterium]
MNKSRLLANLGLLIAAIIWGSTFVAQSAGAELVETFTYQSVRSFIGAAVLIPVILLRERSKKNKPDYIPPSKKDKKLLLIGGVCCGIVLTVAACLQQYGIKFTTVGKSGFITALYVVFVPIAGLFLKKSVRFTVWISVILAAVGLYLLCMTDATFVLSLGDTFVLLCALCFTMHIMVI